MSYNDCPFIRSLYGDFFILAFRRNNPLSQKAGATYGELIITNYDPRPYIQPQFSMFPAEIENGDLVLVHEPACGSLREIDLQEGKRTWTLRKPVTHGNVAGGMRTTLFDTTLALFWMGRGAAILSSAQMTADLVFAVVAKRRRPICKS